jgi:riboflavin synthase
MFTGLVEALGEVEAVQPRDAGLRLSVRHPALAAELRLGESVAVDGVCLSVIEVGADQFAFDVGPETLVRTTLGDLRPGHAVNLERALRLGDRLGGHWVQGHVDGVGRIAAKEARGEWQIVWFETPPLLTRQMVVKGSVAVDGVSLTIVDLYRDRFSVMLIPHTLQQTTLGRKQVGDRVNLETDILAKYVQRLLTGTE